MKNYSETNGSANSTQRDEVIKNFSRQSGIEETHVAKMYDIQQSFGKDTKQINESLQQLLKPEVSDPFKNFSDENIKIENNNTFVSKSIDTINKFVASNPLDSVGLLNIVANVMVTIDPKFNETYKKLEVVTDLEEITGCRETLVQALNESVGEQLTEKVRLFESLKDVLHKNVSKFGVSYHIENVYQEIWNYLNNEIDQLVAAKSIVSKSQDFKAELINQMLNDTINPMYREAQFIKANVPDIQGLVFDMMVFVWKWSQIQDKRVFSMISQNLWKDYVKSTTNLYSAISSSRETSELLIPIYQCNREDNMGDKDTYVGYSQVGKWQNEDDGKINDVVGDLSNVKATYSARFSNYNLQIQTVVDAIYIIKSVSTEFNLGLRPYLKDYVTKSLNLIGRAERVIYELQKVNKFK